MSKRWRCAVVGVNTVGKTHVRVLSQMPNAELVRARSPLELRLRPRRLTDELVTFLDELPRSAPTRHDTAAGAKQ